MRMRVGAVVRAWMDMDVDMGDMGKLWLNNLDTESLGESGLAEAIYNYIYT